MTVFFDDEFDRIFRRMSSSFVNLDELLDQTRNADSVSGPYYYGYTMTTGPDGKPIVKEYGNVKPGLLPGSDTRDPVVDTVVDEKEKTVKLVAEMPGVEKSNINVVIEKNIVKIDAEQDKKKYSSQVPLRIKVDENSVKASYKNGILEVTLKVLEEEKPMGKKVEVE